MSTFTERTTIDAPRHTVWAALADIGAIASWNPGLIGSHRTNDIDGVGGARHCDISAKHSLTEHVVEFEPRRRSPSGSPTRPFRSRPPTSRSPSPTAHSGPRTEVTVSPTYTLKYGPLGRILNTVAVRRTYRAGMRELLEGLKRHLEQHC